MTEFQTLLLFGGMVTFFAATVAGMTGFGYGLVSVPLLMLMLPPRMVVPAVTMHIFLISLLILLEVIKQVDVRRIWPLMVTGLFGLPLGIFVLLILSEGALRTIVGVVIVFFALALLLGLNLEIKNEKLALAPVGISSGLLASGIAMAGPPGNPLLYQPRHAKAGLSRESGCLLRISQHHYHSGSRRERAHNRRGGALCAALSADTCRWQGPWQLSLTQGTGGALSPCGVGCCALFGTALHYLRPRISY